MNNENLWAVDSNLSSIDFSKDYYTINISDTTGSAYTFSSNPYTFSNPNSGQLVVNGEDADVVINGKSMKTFMEKMEERLAILQPDSAKLEKFEALRKAYENYKLIEKMIGED